MSHANANLGGRSTHAKAILGPELYTHLSETKVLLVGAGGIGCELRGSPAILYEVGVDMLIVVKNIVLTGFGRITLLDLDTIDLSNLNRQFLFKKKDVKQSKALVAAKTASAFNPNVQITPIHANIKEPQFDIAWFRHFDIVLNALDNLDARRHVNKMCMAANIPLVESGTAGYLGQVQPILKDRAECFDCVPKPTPKSFPVCTIRSTPSQPIHCIVWAKSYLLPQLFGEDENAVGELDEAEKQGENAQEIATLRKEALAFKAVRAALRTSPQTSQDSTAAKIVFDKVFNSDILNLLSMADMWRSRAPPTPLDFEAIENGTFVHKTPNGTRTNGAIAGSSNSTGNGQVPRTTNSGSPDKVLAGTSSGASSSSTPSGLKDQRALSLQDNLELFVASTHRLAARLRAGEETISFDKDDDDTLDFVTAAANLRSAAYGIAGKSRWEIKEMAGNIIPAIATTNAIIAGLIVLQALHLLRKSYQSLRNVHVQFKPTMPLSTINMCPPNPNCGVCRDTYTEILCDPSKVTLGEVVDGILGDDETGGTGKRDVSVYEDKRILSDPDWDDNYERTLESLNVTRGKFLSIVDDEGEWGTIQVGVGVLPPNHVEEDGTLILPLPRPTPPKKAKPVLVSVEATASLKRPAPDDYIRPSAKRIKTNGTISTTVGASEEKKLHEDGLILLDSKQLDADVIEID
ncbi:Ubiquitin-activating enzyme E1-like protein [Grifola frondosa]|uniref:Ubiquitin-activating enzyme E1-like n=1 Tax=Grifola frondosa TaxID=5627 RepID=A0A1C7MNP4_GRIFR|nr:Ubiquitin-activating enzyme E1-like protein [Grifola frondosa]